MSARVVAVVLARLGSTRFPGKVLADLDGKSLLMHVVGAARAAQSINAVVLATGDDEHDDPLATAAEEEGVAVYRGSESDVLARFAGAAMEQHADHAVRLTVDNPLVTANMVDRVVARHVQTGADYSCNFLPPTFPDGLEVEVVSQPTLVRLLECATTTEEREHVTWYIRTHEDEFHMENVVLSGQLVPGWEQVSLSVDTPDDLQRVGGAYATWRRVLAAID